MVVCIIAYSVFVWYVACLSTTLIVYSVIVGREHIRHGGAREFSGGGYGVLERAGVVCM